MSESPFRIGGLTLSSSIYFISRHFQSGLIVVPTKTHLLEVKETLEYFVESKIPVHTFPAFENFYSLVRQDATIVNTRLNTLFYAIEKQPAFVVTTLDALQQKIPPRAALEKFKLVVKKNTWSERDQIIRELDQLGYKRDSFAEDQGAYSVRGHLLDIYTFHFPNPFRIEFFGDEIISIRSFDPESQRSLHELNEIIIYPCSEFIFKKANWPQVREKLKNFSDSSGHDPIDRDRVLTDIENDIDPLEPRWLLPAAFDRLETLIDYFPSHFNKIIIDPTQCKKDVVEILKSENIRFEHLKKLSYGPNFLRDPEVLESCGSCHELHLTMNEAFQNYQVIDFQSLRQNILIQKNFQPLQKLIDELLEKNLKVKMVIRNKKRESAAKEFLRPSPDLIWEEGPLFEGFQSETFSTAIINERDIFGTRRSRKTSKERSDAIQEAMHFFSDLKIGDFVIHQDHGIAKFLGLQKISLQGQETEFFVLEYLQGDKLYVPIYHSDKVTRYVGDEFSNPRLDRLGSGDFLKRKTKIKNDILKIAHELLDIAAQRKVSSSTRADWDRKKYSDFCDLFPHELTFDQESAIQAVEKDFENPWPMDRLICGDVGFGKTEVAMRAAMLCLLQGKQVAVLAPTTLLVEQHFRNFQNRFSNSSFVVQHLSRFVSTREQKLTTEGLKNGQVHLVIGTHRLLQKDIDFSNLGLLIIDEEQRFGVRHKERIKSLRHQIDVLTLSATPIPRTLQMSVVGIRDLSLITTAPENREEVKTLVGIYNEEVIKEAVQKELHRGGQVLMVHNRVRTIDGFAERMKKLLPEASIVVAHGQMDEHSLEDRMLRFINQDASILIATSIIENGLDIPSANTLIIDHSEMFGLSELYQLRGRVGRSHRSAYAYLFVHENTQLSPEASKRLQVLSSCTALGSGFKIATHDLEIRGAGNLLGEEQSGIIAEVGLELYTQMLEETLKEIKSGPARESLPELNSGYSAFIPEAYIPDAIVRIATYKQLNKVSSPKDLLDLEAALLDRFGLYPKELDNLCQIIRLRTLAHSLKTASIDIYPGRLTMVLKTSTPLEPKTVISLLNKSLSLDPKGKLTYLFPSAVKNPDLVNQGPHKNHPEMHDFKICLNFLKDLLDRAKIAVEAA